MALAPIQPTQPQSSVILAQNVTPSAARGGDPVQAAVNKINSALSEGVTDWDVGHGDLMDARNALNGLTPQQVNQVFSKLSSETLRNWNSEMNGMRGGLSANEKRDQLNFLAQNLAPDQLARVAQNFRAHADRVQFADAVGTFRDANTVGAFASKVLNNPAQGDNLFGSSNAHLAATAIGRMDSSAKLNTALNSLTADQRAQMLNGSVWSPKGVESTAFNRLTDTIVRHGSLAQRTEAFTTIAQHNAKFRDDLGSMPFSSQNFPVLNTPYAAMTKLFNTDPRGMTQLMSSQQPGMQPLTNFLEVATIKGDFKEIGQWSAQIRNGEQIPGSNQSAYARFNHDFDRSANGEDYRNAALSGAFTGSAMAAAINVNLDAGKRRDLAMSLVTGGISTAAAALPVGGQIAVGAGSTIGQPIVKSLLEGAGKDKEDFFNAIGAAGIPRNGDTLPPIGSGGRVAFNASVSEVLNAHGYR
jgi:hypothetical protein